MLKKIISILMCIAVIFSLLSFSSVNAGAVNYDVSRLTALAEKFPDGKYWNHMGSSSNNPDGYTSTPCTHHGNKCGNYCGCNMFFDATQCMGYAYKLANELVGTDVRTWEKRRSLNVNSLCVGDIIRYLNDGHSIVVVGVSGNKIAYTGANWGRNCLIKWGTLTTSQLKGFSYVLHDKNNNLKNSDISFFEGVKAKTNVNFVKASTSSSFEKWKNESSKSTVVYNLPIKNAFKTNSIKKNKTVKIIEKTFDGKTLWGKIDTDDVTGWVKLNSFTFTGGNYKKPVVKEVENAVAGKTFKLKWSGIDGASSYTVNILKKGESGIYKTITTDKTNTNLKINDTGNFYAYVIAGNEKADSWYVQGKKQAFEVEKNKNAKITEINLTENYAISVGGTASLNFDYSPSYASDSLVWTSSNKKVVKVDGGVITALKAGTATITCMAKSNSKVYAKCKITVTDNTAKNLKQSKNGNTENSVTLTWEGAEKVSSYRIYLVKDNGDYKNIGDTKETSFTVPSLEAGKTYRFNVRAGYNKSGKKVWTSFTGETKAKTLPSKVKGIEVTDADKKSFTLSWDKTDGALYYNIYRLNENSGEYEKVGSSSSNSYKIKVNNTEKVYKYAVCAVRKNGSVLLTGEMSKTVHCFTKPSAPTLKVSGIKISWNKADNASGYVIYKLTDGEYKKIAITDAENTSYILKNLAKNNEYSFKIKAYREDGQTVIYSNFSNAVTVVK